MLDVLLLFIADRLDMIARPNRKKVPRKAEIFVGLLVIALLIVVIVGML